MVSTRTRIFTVEEFMAIPTDQPWEVWEGELREVPGAGGEASDIAGEILFRVRLFVKPRNLGLTTGADGTYILSSRPLTIIVPDVGFVRWDQLPGRVRPEGFIPVPPDLAIEVRSPSDRPGAIEEKRLLYREAGVPLIWWVNPRLRRVSIYRRGVLVAELDESGTLDGEDVIPGLSLPIADIFA